MLPPATIADACAATQRPQNLPREAKAIVPDAPWEGHCRHAVAVAELSSGSSVPPTCLPTSGRAIFLVGRERPGKSDCPVTVGLDLENIHFCHAVSLERVCYLSTDCQGGWDVSLLPGFLYMQ